jgi:para-nitrobenzyl esterase
MQPNPPGGDPGGTMKTLLLLAVLVISACTSSVASKLAANCSESDRDIVCTEYGAVRGVVEGEMLAFKGIPYARPPVGALRWRPPEPAAPWQGVRDGDRYGAMCPQISGKEIRGEEDCLFINVWLPREKPTRPLPVMVWLTGGGNHSQSGEGTGAVVFNGERLVPHGVVFVSYNARLGVLGYLAHPALDAERPEKISGNYGSLDHIAMLRWLNRNIAAFGGDPNKIFLFGTSAGGGNICALMTSPLTRGLIHGVAMQSSVPMGCEIQTLKEAQEGTGRRVAKSVGCETGDVAACLRGKSVTEIVNAVPGTFSVLPRVYGPNMDGRIFPEQPLKMIMAGKYPAMPVIIGNTSEETLGWADTAGRVTDEASYASAIEKVFGASARERILANYPAKSYPTPRAAFVQVTTDAQFSCQSRRVARILAKVQREPVYRYIFAHTLENDPALKSRGAAHSIEQAFLFPQGKYEPLDADHSVQRQMVGYWSRIARTGNPNGGREPEWPAVLQDNDLYLEISAKTAAKNDPAKAHCDFWDTITFPWPHL